MSRAISAVVCAYTEQRWEDIVAALSSLAGQRPQPLQLILVVDHNDALLERARREFPDVDVVANAGRRGLSGARNTGVSVARGEIVAFVDDDASAEAGWSRAMLAAYDDPGVIGVGGWVEPRWLAERPPWFPDEFLWVVGCSYRGLPPDGAAIRNGIGANMSFRRDVFARVGGFDEAIGRLGRDAAGCEETELSIRALARTSGSRVVLAAGCRVRHTVPASRVTRSYFRRRCLAEGRSKALVASLAGTGPALSVERSYVVRTLLGGVVDQLRGRDGVPGARRRAWAIVEGLALTSWGYLSARLRSRNALATRTARRNLAEPLVPTGTGR